MKHLVRFDWAVKRLLRNKANYGILEGLLSELLLDDIKIEAILEGESNQNTGDNKYNRVDLLVKDTKGELIIIEVQSSRVQDFLMRMLFGTAKLITDNMDIGMGYNKIKKIISLNIVYFDLGHGQDYIYHGTTSFVGMHKHDVLQLSAREQNVYKQQQIEKLYPEYYIIKVNQFDGLAKNGLDEWIYFFKNDEIKADFKAKGLDEAKKKLNILNFNKKELAEYESFIKDWRYENSLVVSNYESGRADERKELETMLKAKDELIAEKYDLIAENDRINIEAKKALEEKDRINEETSKALEAALKELEALKKKQ